MADKAGGEEKNLIKRRVERQKVFSSPPAINQSAFSTVLRFLILQLPRLPLQQLFNFYNDGRIIKERGNFESGAAQAIELSRRQLRDKNGWTVIFYGKKGKI